MITHCPFLGQRRTERLSLGSFFFILSLMEIWFLVRVRPFSPLYTTAFGLLSWRRVAEDMQTHLVLSLPGSFVCVFQILGNLLLFQQIFMFKAVGLLSQCNVTQHKHHRTARSTAYHFTKPLSRDLGIVHYQDMIF